MLQTLALSEAMTLICHLPPPLPPPGGLRSRGRLERGSVVGFGAGPPLLRRGAGSVGGGEREGGFPARLKRSPFDPKCGAALPSRAPCPFEIQCGDDLPSRAPSKARTSAGPYN